ncbi:peptidase domain-containing ABC transporter [Planctobacterium marinum]|uniref:ABC transporter n=1 Tax=Planctobacterium marinum TaxID=1631968 RepID=A0AA48HHP9_9ALTE|nr:ABC transporter [Planctobacterium marinum]
MNKLPVYLQSEIAECGLVCVAMMLSYHGSHQNLVSLRRRHQVSSQGLTLDNLVDIAHVNGLVARPLKVEIDAIKHINLPCVLHWNMNHFVVLKKVTAKHVVIHDPGQGVRHISLSEFGKSFTGVALELFPGESFVKKEVKEIFSIRQLWQQITGLKRNLAKVFGLSLFLQLFTLLAPYYLQVGIDRIIPTHDSSLLIVIAFAFGLVLVFQQIATLLRSFVIFHLGSLFSIQVSGSLFKHLLSLPLSFFEKRDVGDIVTRFDSLNKVRDFLTSSLITLIIDALMALTLVIAMFYYHAGITALVLFFVAIYAAVRVIAFKRFRQLNEQEIKDRARERSNFIESIQGIQTIMGFDGQSRASSQWMNFNSEYVNSNLKVKKTREWYRLINGLNFGVENILVVYLFILSVIAGQATIGMLVAYLAYKRIFISRISSLIDKLMEFKMLRLHLERVSDIALTEPVREPATPKPPKFKGDIELKDVSYQYDEFSDPVFSNLNLSVQRGEYIAITGLSGSGKSTLVKILLGLLEPSKGTLSVDGVDLRRYGAKNYREHVASVMQDDRLYAGSILENITFFDATPDVKKAIECAQIAHAHRMILSKPMGYNSLLSHQGGGLSGGEKQRILLARALYKNPVILIMDEATSNLDLRVERSIGEAICKLQITRIVIAHRPQTIQSADRIFRLTSETLLDVTEKHKITQIAPAQNA